MDKLRDFISRQKCLKPIEAALGAAADTIFLKDVPVGEKVRNFFHGTLFGHPLHPVITDVPLSAWRPRRRSTSMNSLPAIAR